MRNGLKIYILAFLLLIAPVFAQAEWYWLTIPEDPAIGDFTELSAVEYAVTSIPKHQLQTLPETFMETMDLTKESNACSGEYSTAVQELRDFDTTNTIYAPCVETLKNRCYELDISQETINARDTLLANIEKNAQRCLQAEHDELEEQAKKEAEKKRLVEVQEAVDDCDFDYFENEMTNEERMDTWDQRQVCTKEVEIEKEEQEEVLPVIESMQPTPEIKNIPTVTPVTPSNIPQRQQVTYEQEVVDITKTNDVENIESTLSEETVIITNTETKQSKIEQVDTHELQQQENPTIFKRIANFFLKLFSW